MPLPHPEFSPELSPQEQDNYRILIDKLSRPSAMARSDEYELFSMQKAKISRQVLELSEEEAMLLALYSRAGLIINYYQRNFYHNDEPMTHLNTNPQKAREHIEKFKQRFGGMAEDIVRIKKKYFEGYILRDANFMFIKAAQFFIDQLILKYESLFAKTEHVYRISRAKKGVYDEPQAARGATPDNTVSVGDIIADRALWSSASNASTTLFRYSHKAPTGSSASNSKSIDPSEEEILFVIEHNEDLKAIDISGFKKFSGKKYRTSQIRQDKFSSGELLIKSASKFKVIGIQKADPRIDRRIVILRPVPYLKPNETIRNPYSGSPIPLESILTEPIMGPSPEPIPLPF